MSLICTDFTDSLPASTSGGENGGSVFLREIISRGVIQ